MPNRPEPKFFDLFDVRRLGNRRTSSLDRQLQIGFLIVVVLIALGTWLAHHHTRVLHDSQRYVSHTHEVLGEMQSVLTTLVDAETGAHGYLITGDESLLETYTNAEESIGKELTALESLTSDNSGQAEALALLRQRVTQRLGHLERVMTAARDGRMNEASALVRTGEGSQRMEDVRRILGDVQAREESLLARRESIAAASYRTTLNIVALVGIVGIFSILTLFLFVRRFDRLRAINAQQVSDSRNRFETALASIGDAVLVTDAEGRVAYCNAGCDRILGIRPADIGRSIDDMFTLITESTGRPAEPVIKKARSQRGVQRVDADVVLRRLDGTRIPVDVTSSPLLGGNGSFQGAILVALDVSEKREREREVRRSTERFRSLVEATSQIVWTTDADGYVREDSPSWRQITGQSYEQWQGHGWLEALHADDRSRIITGWMEAVTARRPFSGEYRLRQVDGTYRWNMVRAVPVLDEGGSIREWVGMNHDIQARKEAEEAQRDANSKKDVFIALLAHELRNPLAPIRNGLEILKAGPRDDAPRAIELLDRQVRHMVRLIDDLLDLSRISQGKLELRFERLDVREILHQAADAARPAVLAKQQHLSVNLPAAPLWVEGDSVRLTQVVTNLLNNAVKYSGKDAHIWLHADRDGSHHVIGVRDTGQGIPTEMRSRIWDLFLQGGGRAERVEGGLGIGLTLVKRIVELHGGTVEVASEGVGTGSEFTVRIPTAAAPGPGPRVERPADSPTATRRSLSILVIDDNEDSAESLCMLLRTGGHTVQMALSGDAGLTAFTRFEPDLVLCDIRMPDMSGYEVARRLRSHPRGTRPMLVALTGFGTVSDREASARAGFDRHLVKPVDPDALAEALRGAAERAEA